MAGTKLAQSMTKTAIQESGERGSPENQPRTGAKEPEAQSLTAESVSSLLRSEFVTAEPKEPEPAPDNKEVQEGERAGETDSQEKQKVESRKQKTEAEEETETEGETETEETDQEAEAEAKAEPAELPGELQAAIEQWEEAGKGELPLALQTLVERRIGKLTAQREEQKTAREAAESRIKELESEVSELRTNPSRPAPATLANVDEKQLAKLESSAEVFLGEAEAYLDDSATEDERGRVERYMADNHLELAQLKRKVREVSHWLNRTAPEQRRALAAFREQESAVEPDVKRFFPWMDKKESAEYKLAQDVLALVPELTARTPAHRVALGVYVLGLQEFAKLKTKTNGKPPVVKAPVRTPASGAAAPAVRVNGKQANEESARQRFNGSMNRESVAELLKAGLRD
jgi:hypothetical protein